GLHLIGHGQSVGTRRLIHGDNDRRLAVETSNLLVNKGAQFDARDVFQPHDGAVRILSHDDVAELFRIGQAARGADRVSELLALWSGLASDLTSRVYGTLLLHRIIQVRDGEAQLRE